MSAHIVLVPSAVAEPQLDPLAAARQRARSRVAPERRQHIEWLAKCLRGQVDDALAAGENDCTVGHGCLLSDRDAGEMAVELVLHSLLREGLNASRVGYRIYFTERQT